MDLKKWEFGTPMGEQIEEQNANITEIDANLTRIEDALKQSLVGRMLKGGEDLNNVSESWVYAGEDVLNRPLIHKGVFYYVNTVYTSSNKIAGLQIAYQETGTPRIYLRFKYASSGWTDWAKVGEKI